MEEAGEAGLVLAEVEVAEEEDQVGPEGGSLEVQEAGA